MWPVSLNGILPPPPPPPPPRGSVDGATWETRVQGVPARPLMSQHFPVQAPACQPVVARISLPLAVVPERRDGSRGWGAGEEPCRAGAALVCGEQPLPVRGPMGCCPKRKGKTAARGLGAQQLHRRGRRQAPVCRRGPRPAVIAAGSRWHSPTLPGTLRPPALSRVGLALRSSHGAPLAGRPGSVLGGRGGRLSPPALSPVSLTEGTERTEIQGRGGFGVPLPTACALAEVPQGGVG
ncbi:hypothetical protein KIL84_015184 [Mauremys mutica]|uniref:Uncharacterized protein n=1 Tax=Mauremys mutica TaxID=74926 RepID=A0A9D3WQ06_9SAUR|nr:hypothetical protein KIL84_015184 [Mauremys mutica]